MRIAAIMKFRKKMQVLPGTQTKEEQPKEQQFIFLVNYLQQNKFRENIMKQR